MQDAFARDDILVVVATVAFGMGIDKTNVRFVVHYDLPKNIESYYQETGRAGRDGLPAEALLLFGLGDASVVRALIEGGGRAGSNGGDAYERDPEQVRVELHKLDSMVGYADGAHLPTPSLLGYFGEELGHDCGNCDICLDPPETYDATEHAQMALSCVYRVGQSFGMAHVVDVLRGADSDKVRARGHERLSTYGIGAQISRDHWHSLLRQLIHRGYLTQDIARYSVLRPDGQGAPPAARRGDADPGQAAHQSAHEEAATGGGPLRARRRLGRPRDRRSAVRGAARPAQAPRGGTGRPRLRGVQRRNAG